MRNLRLEFAKLRRKHVALASLLLVAAVLAWLSMDAHQEGPGSAAGWHSLHYAAPIMNSVFLSLLASVVASRVADVDHEAHAYKQLLCLQRSGSLLAAKATYAALVMALSVLAELAGMAVLGQYMGFVDTPGTATWGSLLVSQLAASLFVVTLVGAIALWWENQFVSIACGLALSLAGLFSSFLPTPLQRLVPSGYFTLLTTLRIEWVGATGTFEPQFSETAPPLGDYALLAAFTVSACIFAYVGFSRKEH